jgi:hypothetical protein
MRAFVRFLNLALLLSFFLIPAASFAQIAVSIRIGPPALPVYAQPPCPGDGYLWTPGYWAYGPLGYYWVPGVWVLPPRPLFLWTPGYWGFAGGFYGWHAGYWGPHIGFYGGINYGFGYGGVGFFGGRWEGERFVYNTAVTNVNTTVVRNVYVDKTVINNTTVVNNHTSFNGPGGVTAKPTPAEQTAARENHVQPTSNQLAHEHTASQDHNQLASVNHGRPATAAMDSVGGHHYNPQGRVANGAGSGRTPPSEAARRQQNNNGQAAANRQGNGGRRTPEERKNINQRPSGGGQADEERRNEKREPR